MNTTAATILELHGISRRFGGIVAIDNLSFNVSRGAIHGLIGPNGAGKTTTFNVISGFYAPDAGRVLYNGANISRRKTSEIAKLGLIRTFQGTLLFHEMTVLENVRLGRHLSARSSLLSRLTGRDRAVEEAATQKARDLLCLFGLEALAQERASSLSHGHQRALGMAVALAADPQLLLLDEPFTGMNPEETQRMMALIRQVRDRGITIMLVEHDMQAVMGLCDVITVMNFGTLLAEGTPAEIRKNPKVIEAYLGSAQHVA